MRLKAVSGMMLTLLMASLVIVLASPIPVIAQTNSTTTIYLDPPTVNGTAIGVNNTVTVNIRIRDAPDTQGWQAGLIFNPDLLECTGFEEGEFLSDAAGPKGTMLFNGTIDNTAGTITAYICTLLEEYYANGSGRLAYATFKVKAPGVSDLHLRDVKLSCWIEVEPGVWELLKIPTNIIDVYTVIVNATAHTVVTVSNSTGMDAVVINEEIVTIGSNFSDHAFTPSYGISFNVTGPYPGFSNVTIPKTLLSPVPSNVWAVIVDGERLSAAEVIATENATHTSIYFTYTLGVHKIQITTGPRPVGGIWIPADKLALLAPYIGLASTIFLIIVATAVFVKLKKKKK